jgi:hypothetical protein
MSLRGGLGVTGFDCGVVSEGEAAKEVVVLGVRGERCEGLLSGREEEEFLARPGARELGGVRAREPSPSELHRAFSRVTSCSSVR